MWTVDQGILDAELGIIFHDTWARWGWKGAILQESQIDRTGPRCGTALKCLFSGNFVRIMTNEVAIGMQFITEIFKQGERLRK